MLGCLGLLLSIAVALWAARDLPRRALQTALSDRLAAQVGVERLEVLGSERFRLVGLSIASLRHYPAIETLTLDEVMIEGPLRGILGNRFDRLRLRGVEVRLAPAPAVEPPDRPLPRIGELVLEPASIRVAAGPGRDDLRLCLTAVVRELGSRATGEARLTAATLELRPLLDLFDGPPGLAARVETLDAALTFGPGGAELAAGAGKVSLARGGARLELSRARLDAVRAGPTTVARFGAAAADARRGERVATAAEPGAEVTVTAAEDGALRVEVVPRLAGLEDGRLEVDLDPARERIDALRGRLHGLDLRRLLPHLGLDAIADVELRGAGERLDYRLEITPRQLVAADVELRGIEGAAARIAGSLPLVSIAALEAPVLAGPLEAALEIPAGHGRWGALTLPPSAFPLTVSIDGRWLGGDAPGFAGSYRLQSPAVGRLRADGDIAGLGGEIRAELTWEWARIDLERLLELLRHAGLRAPALALAGSGEARGSLRHGIGGDGPEIRARLRVAGVEAAAPAGADETALKAGRRTWRLTGGETTAAVGWAGGRAPIRLRRMQASGIVAAPGLEALSLVLETAGSFTADGTRGRLEGAIRERTERGPAGLGSARFSGDWRRRSIDSFELGGRLDLEALDLARWQEVARPLAEAGWLAGYRLTGSAGAELEAEVAGGAWRLAGPVRLESAGFAAADGSRVSEGLDSRWQVSARGASSAPIELEGSGVVGGFQLLWNTFFGDFTDVEAELSASATLEPAGAGGRRWRLGLEAALPGGPIAEASFASEGDGWRYTASLDDRDLAATHGRYLAPLLEQQLGRLDLGGKLAARIRGEYRAGGGTPAWSLAGGVEIQDLRLASGGGQVTVAGLDLDLPLDLRRRPGAGLDFSGPRLGGRIAFRRLAVRGLELPPTESDLAVEADSVGLEEPIALAVLGGALTLERLTLRQLLRPSRHLESGLEITGLRLERISDELGLFPLEGALNGHLTGVRLSPSRLAVDGGGRIEVFGGLVEVRDISGQDVLSPFPRLELSADFRDLDLGALTRRLDFGEMTGVLQGTLEDCELFRGVPVRFSARLETVHRPGVPRTVDVKAVNNITILGTGQRAGVLDRGIQRFFDRYTYERLGVSLRLDNDVLLLRGLERRGDKELFLRGRLPLRIDVVNAQPGKTVSFQTMVGRLRSLDFARATTRP